MPPIVHFHDAIDLFPEVDSLLIIGRKHRLLEGDVRAALPLDLSARIWEDMVNSADATDAPLTATTYTGSKPRKVVVGLMPESCSRHNAPSRAWAVPSIVRALGRRGPQAIVFALDDPAHAFACATHLAAALPSWSGTSRQGERTVHVAFLGPQGPITGTDRLFVATEATRKAASWVDMPPDLLDTRHFVQIARDIAQDLKCSAQVIQGAALRDQGLGGLFGVGRAAKDPPALVVLDYDPGKASKHIAWVGKGIVYDTGGLSLKTKVGMVGMKTDMGGAAAVLAAFEAAVRLDCPHRLTAILCIAENAIGPEALRPDDILRMLSGKTVEVNNTDAEGRLVLADGLAWAVKYRAPDELIDMATLTGAQGVATGRMHAALYCNDEQLEQRAVLAGLASGDTVHPLPYCPEFFRPEFASQVADMRNSVKNRSNAQSSCAGQFLANHIEDFQGPWLHVDMAAPSANGSRGTGFGVPLLLTLADVGA